MIKQILFLLIISICIVGCSASKKSNQKKHLDYIQSTDDYLPQEYFDSLRASSNADIKSVLSNTTDFYKVKLVSEPHKKVFNLKEAKLFSLKITNYGTKELYMPEWLKAHNLDNNPEISIEIYKKKGKKFRKYVQKRMTTDTFFQPHLNQNRTILSSSKGKCITYDAIGIDTFYKIVDTGIYHVKIYIDLSNFGYFKTLETDLFFEVTNQ